MGQDLFHPYIQSTIVLSDNITTCIYIQLIKMYIACFSLYLNTLVGNYVKPHKHQHFDGLMFTLFAEGGLSLLLQPESGCFCLSPH